MLGSVENKSPTWTSLSLSASTVCGPPASSGTKSQNKMPYTSCRPVRQYGRWGHSGGAPSVSWSATGASDDIVVRLNCCAVCALATKVFWSCAGDGVSTETPLAANCVASSAATTRGSLECSPFGARYRSSDDRYSGFRSITPDSSADCETSRDRRPNWRSTVYPACSSTWAYISATSWFSVNEPETPTTIVPLPPLDGRTMLGGEDVQAAAPRQQTSTTAAIRRAVWFTTGPARPPGATQSRTKPRQARAPASGLFLLFSPGGPRAARTRSPL